MTTDKPTGGRMATLPGEDDDEMSSITGPDDGNVTKTGSVSMAPVATAATGIEQLVALLKAKETELRTLQKTHDEYVKSSCEYEKELEAEIERFEKKSHPLEQLIASLETAKTLLQTTLTQAQHELSVCKKREDAQATQVQEMKWKIQRLEQTNDELETANRVAQASIDELQHQVDSLTEENVFLIQEKEDASTANATATASDEETKTDESPGVTGSEPTNRKVLEKRRSVRYPDVVESCLHMTCTNGQCRRASHVHQLQNSQIPAMAEKSLAVGAKSGKASKTGEKTKRSFFERLRLRFMRG